ncbi:hypothetical protein [Nakamurella lactea]|uniref:hypothetical protein n=1 Tax=Nakamurella lactea TaxID=459515 RepID=UPI00048C7364|nr:hypothetical protein [Nakamurella lactea]
MHPSSWQLGHYDVDDVVVSSPGCAIDELLGFRPRNLDELSRYRRPRTGWRLIHGERPIPPRGGLSVIAAPWPEAGPSAWSLLDIANPYGHAQIGRTGPVVIRVGRAVRRRGLVLEWPVASLAHDANERFVPSVLLRNTADAEWVGDGHDHSLVTGELLRVDGTPLPRSLPRWGVGAQVMPLGPIPALSVTTLTVDMLDNADPDAIPPGSYLIRARHVNLELSTPAISLVVSA